MNLFISGGAGFIGSNLVNTIVLYKNIKKITIYDNFSSGKNKFDSGPVAIYLPSK